MLQGTFHEIIERARRWLPLVSERVGRWLSLVSERFGRWLSFVAAQGRDWLPAACRRVRRDRELHWAAVGVLVTVQVAVAAAGLNIVGGPVDDADGDCGPQPCAAMARSQEDAEGSGLDATTASGSTPPAEMHSGVAVPADPDVLRTAEELTSENLPARGMPYEYYRAHAADIIASLPSLEVKRRHFPASPMTRDTGAQRAHIAMLDEQAEVSVEGFDELTIDTSRRKAFVDIEHYHERIEPRMFIVHWTAMGYDDVDHFVESLKPFRVQFFIDRDADVYDLFETDEQLPAHAQGANRFAQGVEIETGRYDGTRSPLFAYTPEQIEQTVYLAVEFLRRNDLPVDQTTLLGHYAADLIFTNPYYAPHQASFSRDRIRKFDPPEELMHVIVRKAQELDAALDARAGEEALAADDLD